MALIGRPTLLSNSTCISPLYGPRLRRRRRTSGGKRLAFQNVKIKDEAPWRCASRSAVERSTDSPGVATKIRPLPGGGRPGNLIPDYP